MSDLMFLSSEMDEFIVGMMGLYMMFMAAYSIFGLVSYILTSLGMYTIADRRGIPHAWMAWVPVLNYWTLGSISDQYQQVAKGKTTRRRITMIVLEIVMLVLAVAMVGSAVGMMIQSIGLMGQMAEDAAVGLVGAAGFMILAYLAMLGVAIALLVFYYICLYDLYCSSNPSNGALYLVLTIFISVTMPFLIFACRNKDLGMQPKYQPPVYPQFPQYQAYQQPQYQPPVYQPPVYQPQSPDQNDQMPQS